MKIKMGNTLDLHGTKHSEAWQKVDNFIGQHIMKNTREVEIITGHSQGMKNIVNEVILEYGGKSQEAWMNPGKLIIDLT